MATRGRPLKFKTEKEFCNFLFDRKDEWFSNFSGGADWDVFEREWKLGRKKHFSPQIARIDFMIESEDGGRIGIECKNNLADGELSKAISQLLGYAVLAEEYGYGFSELWLFIPDYCELVAKVIKKYNLPIRVFILNKEVHSEILIC